MNTWLMLLLWKPSLLMAAALLAVALQRRASAATRTLTAQLGLLAALLLPLAWLAMPSIALSVPLLVPSVSAGAPTVVQADGPSTPATAIAAAQRSAASGAPISQAGAPAAPSPFPRIGIAAGVYLAIAVALLLRTCHAALRLHLLARGASPIADPVWRATLDTLSKQMEIKSKVRVLESQHITSPFGWGVRQPVILIDQRSVASANPRDILCHELAHVARCDWPALMLARLACALYWFNPLCWLLARKMEQQMEHAADDCVIGQGAQVSSYAQTLLQVGMRGAGGFRHAANGIAPARSALGQRIASLLDARRNRSPAKPAQIAAYAVAAVLISGPLSALELASPALAAASGKHIQGRLAGGVEDQLERLGNANFTALAKAMRLRDYALRHAGGSAASFEVAAAVASLTQALADPDPVVRQLAVWGFSEMRLRDSAALVAPLLKDDIAAVRGEAARALGDIGATAMTPKLAVLLKDADPGVRRQAAHALGDLQEQTSMAALLVASADPDDDVQAEVRWAIKEVREK